MLTSREFKRAFQDAKPGTWVKYYHGFLWAERQLGDEFSDALNKLGRAAWALYKNGEATLVQKRNGTGCEYYAVKL